MVLACRKLDRILLLVLLLWAEPSTAVRGCLNLLLKGLWRLCPMPPHHSSPQTPGICVSLHTQLWSVMYASLPVKRWQGGQSAHSAPDLSMNLLSPHCAPGLGCRRGRGKEWPGRRNQMLSLEKEEPHGWWWVFSVDLESAGPQVCSLASNVSPVKGVIITALSW